MKKTLCVIAAVLLYCSSFAQTTISLVVSGEGASKPEATAGALRSAIEQAFGTFVSANTAILNDEIVKDEIATVSSGNIIGYDELSAFETNGRWYVTVKAMVSIGQLVNYVQSKGAQTEFAGRTFAMQMKMRELNKENEMQALLNLVKQVELLACSYSFFDYELEQGEAEYVDGVVYKIPLSVSAISNKNYDNVVTLIDKTFQSLALSEEEQASYAMQKYPINQCRPLSFHSYLVSRPKASSADWEYGEMPAEGLVYDKGQCFHMRSEEEFLRNIEYVIRRQLELNEHCFQLEREGDGSEYRIYLEPYKESRYSTTSFTFSPKIPLTVLEVTTRFKVFPNLSLREPSIEAVDLGLSVKWGTANVGAYPINPYGDYYSWGETEVKGVYKWSTYKWCNGARGKLTKYCSTNETGSWDGDGEPDGKIALDPEDDVAHVVLGGSWRVPTVAEWNELKEQCSWAWQHINGVGCYCVTGPNGNSIFLPAVGYRLYTDFYYVGLDGYYWSSSLSTYSQYRAFRLSFDREYCGTSDYNADRFVGYSVRPVCE